MNPEILPKSLLREERLLPRWGWLLVIAVFLLCFLPWLFPQRQLSQKEGLYAAAAAEFQPGKVTAHGIVRNDVKPFYPGAAALLYRSGLPMESALRIVSITMLGAWAMLLGCAAMRRRNARAGIVTFCTAFGTFFALEKSVYGGPESMTAFFLSAAQLLFFDYGSRKANWNRAWFSAAILMALAFLSGGLIAYAYFIFPIFFFRRPISLRSKFNSKGFYAALVLTAAVILLWSLPVISAVRHNQADIQLEIGSNGDFWKHLLTFFPLLPIRLLPWSFLMWLPLCTALQDQDETPAFSRYLRTLFFSSLLLSCLLPGRPSGDLFYSIGPLALLTGMYYEAGIRRWGQILRALLLPAFLLPLALLFLCVATPFIPDAILHGFGKLSQMIFLQELWFLFPISLTAAAAILLTAIFWFGRKEFPIWTLFLAICCTGALFYSVFMLPYRCLDRQWRVLGEDLTDALLPAENSKKMPLYKWNISGMYCGLFYVGRPIIELRSLRDLPAKEPVVYLISPELPAGPDRTWIPLLPRDYRCQGHSISLWRGELRKTESKALPDE